jgi:hypothetical protein
MEIGSVQQMISQMPHENPLGEITMERLSHKLIFAYFVKHDALSCFWVQRYK